MTRRIVYTRPDGGVSICCPSPEFLGWLSSGGYWKDKPRGWVDGWIDRRVAEGRQEWAAAQFARKVQEGGCTTAEAYAVIRDLDCLHCGSAHEVFDLADIPSNRWFRDAWARSHNGGPIGIAMPKARKIQLKRIAAFSRENGISLQISLWRERIRRASSPEDLIQIFPKAGQRKWH